MTRASYSCALQPKGAQGHAIPLHGCQRMQEGIALLLIAYCPVHRVRMQEKSVRALHAIATRQ